MIEHDDDERMPREGGEVEDPRADDSTPDGAMQAMYMLRWSTASIARDVPAPPAPDPADPFEPPCDEPHPYLDKLEGGWSGTAGVPRGRHRLEDLFRETWVRTEERLGRRMFREGDVVDWFDGRRIWRTKVAWIELRHPPMGAVISFDRGKRLLRVPFDSLTFVRHSTRKIRPPWEIPEANRAKPQQG